MIWSPPAIIDPHRLRLSACVRAAVNLIRPDVICLPWAGMGELVAGIGGGPRLIVSESDPALRAVWEAAQRRLLTAAVPYGTCGWKGCQDGRLGFEVPADTAGRPKPTSSGAFRLLASCINEHPYASYPPHVYAGWAIAVAAGAGCWSRDAQGRFNAPLAEGELTERIFPFVRGVHHYPAACPTGRPARLGEWPTTPDDIDNALRMRHTHADWHTRAAASDAWAREHVAEVCATEDEAFGHANAALKAGKKVLLVLDHADAHETTIRAIGAGVSVIAFAADETIDVWAPSETGTEIRCADDRWRPVEADDMGSYVRASSTNYIPTRALETWPRRRAGIVWTRADEGDWIGTNGPST